MTALVVVDVSGTVDLEDAAARLDIFPGGPTPAVFPAGAPFWVGYGFASDSAASAGEALAEDATRFELEVDGRAVDVRSILAQEGELVTRKTLVATFPFGLPAGWHGLTGRWYDRGKLLFTSHVRIEFVDR
jgi:hypothetical protein